MPGEAVKKDEPLRKLDDHELTLQFVDAMREHDAKLQEANFDYAQNPPKLSEGKEAEKLAEAAYARAKLFDWRIKQATIKSPIDGVVLNYVNGDLRDKIDSVVKLGDPLLVVGVKNDLRVEVTVPEREIQMVREGKSGKIATTAMPSATTKII